MVDDKLSVLAPQVLYFPGAGVVQRPISKKRATIDRLISKKNIIGIQQRVKWYRMRIAGIISDRIFSVSKSKRLKWLPFLAVSDYPGARALGRAFRYLQMRTATQIPISQIVGPGEDLRGNILIVPEVTWNRRDWHPVRQFQAQGGKVVTIVYDLIPILHPDPSYNAANRAHYEAWVELMVARSDAVIADSRAVAHELRSYLEQAVPKRAASIPIGHFHLGSDFDVSQLTAAELPPEIAAIFATTHHAFLMVGSITPRKNHRFVLDAFDRYWANGGTAKLIFVGYASTGTDEFLRQIKSHPHNGTLFHHLTNINDGELETIYRLSAALIMASSAEGFGLPLVEALQRGVPVLCSDIPVFHEVTAERAEFFALDSPDALSALIVDFESRHPPGQPIPREPKKCLSWRESTDMMLKTMFELLNRN
jgi:glycosyltransferase involved in cell wall biosynthesis